MDIMHNIENGLIVMAGGVGGVFFVLILFYFVIILLQKMFPYKSETDGGNE